MTLIEALRGSIYIEECEKAMRAATTVEALTEAGKMLDQPEFKAIGSEWQLGLMHRYAERLQQITGAYVL